MTMKYTQLTMDERTFIQLGLMVALKPAQIALELSRSTSTITREFPTSTVAAQQNCIIFNEINKLSLFL